MRQEVRQFLMQPTRTARRILELEQKVKALEETMLPSGVRYDRDRVQGTREDPMLRFAEKVDGLLDDIKELKAQYLDEMEAVEKAIAGIDNETERCVLTMRWINGMRYEQIADKLGYAESSVFRLHRHGVRNLKLPKDKR